MKNLETRVVQKIEVRADESGAKQLFGYAARFNEPSEDLGGFIEYCRQGAFTRSLQENDIRCLYNHETCYVLGRNTSGTLQLKEDNEGLFFVVDLPNTTVANDVYESVKRGDISGCSFGFMIRADKWTPNPDGTYTHELFDVDLIEVTICAFPAYPSTDVSVRSLEKVKGTPRKDRAKQILTVL